MGVRSSGYNTKVRACEVQEWFLWGRHMTITSYSTATITEMTAIATVVACATRKTWNDELLRVPATRASNYHMQRHVTESVAGRRVGHSMWIWKKWGISYTNNASLRGCPEGPNYASATRHEKWIIMRNMKYPLETPTRAA